LQSKTERKEKSPATSSSASQSSEWRCATTAWCDNMDSAPGSARGREKSRQGSGRWRWL